MNYHRRLDELESRLPKDTVWYLADGTEFRSDLTVCELIVAGHEEVRAGGATPILDAAAQTVRSSDGSALHELFAATWGPVLKAQGIATPVSPLEAAPIKAFRATNSNLCPN
jgi:hypothetical protein